jgi:hypothetical protein
MTARTRRWRLAGLVTLGVIVATGCNMLEVPFFLINGPDPMQPPECMKLTPPEGRDKKAKVRVVLLVSVPGEMRPEFIRVDRDLSELLIRKLNAGFKEDKENIVLLPTSKVEKFKDEHPGWRTMELADIGKQLGADYVIDMEINSISLYEDKSYNQMYRGRAAISTTLVAMHKLDDGPMRKEYSCTYPTDAKGPVPVGLDMNYQQFRTEFLDYVAKHLAWFFVPHPYSDEISCE